MINARYPQIRQNNNVRSRLIPIEVVERLRYDPAWSEAVQHLEQGLLGLGINYAKYDKKSDSDELEQTLKDEIDNLKTQISELRSKVRQDSMIIESGVRDEVQRIGDKVTQLREDVKRVPKQTKQKPCRKSNTDRTSIQVSREFKQLLKVMKGKRSYEDLLREKMSI